MSGGTLTPRTPRTPGTPFPTANTQAVNDLLILMKSNLNTLGATFDSLGEQSAKVASLGPALDTAHQIHQLRRQMRNQEKVHGSPLWLPSQMEYFIDGGATLNPASGCTN